MSYFIAFDFFSTEQKFNKFWYGIIEIDLHIITIQDAAKNIIYENYPDIDLNLTAIKITAFNNINL